MSSLNKTDCRFRVLNAFNATSVMVNSLVKLRRVEKYIMNETK